MRGDDILKSFKRFILFFFILIIVAPIAMGGLALIKDDTMPEYLVGFDYTNYDGVDVLLEKLGPMALATISGERSLPIDEETVNKILYKEANGFQSNTYDLLGGDFLVKGVWVRFESSQLSAYALINYQGVETTLTISIGVEDFPEYVKLNINSIKIGQLPLPKALFTYVLNEITKNYSEYDIKSFYEEGEVNYDKLYITINKAYINQLISENVGSNFLIFSNIEIIEENILINYTFDQTNPNAVAFESAINELNRIINDESLISDVNNLVSTDPDLAAFQADFVDVMDYLKRQVANPNITGSLPEEDLELFKSLATHYQNIDDVATRSQILTIIESKIDDQVIANFNTALSQLDPQTLETLSLGNYADFTAFIDGLLAQN